MDIKSALVVASHPDDEILGCGGTISKLSDKGIDCRSLILSKGILSRDIKGISSKKAISKLLENTKSASKIIGYKKHYQFDFPDNQFDTVPLLQIVKKIEQVIEEFKPQTIFTHHLGDLNKDHVITHRASLIASRPMEGNFITNVVTFETPSSSEWSFSQFENFQPNLFINIEKSIEKKIAAMNAYDNEIRSFPHPRSSENLKAISEYRGSSVGMKKAEAFQIVRSISE